MIYKRSPPLVQFPALPSAPAHLEAHIVAPFAPLPPLDLDQALNMEDDVVDMDIDDIDGHAPSPPPKPSVTPSCPRSPCPT